MPFPSKPLEPLLALCERLYARDGYVKWTEAAKELGVSRQAVHDRLKRAVAQGQLAAADFERFRSISSRASASKRRDIAAREERKLHIQIQLTPENLTWIRTECEVRNVRSSDIINGLITKARNQAAHGSTCPQP